MFDFSTVDLIEIFISFSLGLVVAFSLKAKKKKSSLSSMGNNKKLNQEILEDEVHHLKAKIETLEKALEMKLK